MATTGLADLRQCFELTLISTLARKGSSTRSLLKLLLEVECDDLRMKRPKVEMKEVSKQE